MLEVILVLGVVRASILPSELTSSVHLVLGPLANKLATITPCVGALSRNVVVCKLSVVCCATLPGEDARAALCALFVLPNILCTIRPCLSALPMLLVRLP